MTPLDPELPPPGEEIHLPGPSLKPFLISLSITASITGVTLGPVLWVPGVIVTLVIAVLWIGDTRREIDALPAEHRH